MDAPVLNDQLCFPETLAELAIQTFVLEILFSMSADASITSQLLRVRWIKDSGANAWLIGGEFAHELSPEDLETFFLMASDFFPDHLADNSEEIFRRDTSLSIVCLTASSKQCMYSEQLVKMLKCPTSVAN